MLFLRNQAALCSFLHFPIRLLEHEFDLFHCVRIFLQVLLNLLKAFRRSMTGYFQYRTFCFLFVLLEGATWSTFCTDSHHSEYLLSGQICKMIGRGIAPNLTCHFEISLTQDLSF